MPTVLTELAGIKNHASAMRTAQARLDLRLKGWRGVEEMAEVVALRERCPNLAQATRLVSEVSQNYGLVEAVFRAASETDRTELRGYFLVKAALEELSGRLIGPAAGSCDKMAAFIHIWQTSPGWV